MTDTSRADGAPLLSFCIPTYNRAASLVPLVRRVLSCAAPEIEVVVSDNGSTDDTLPQLAAIDDPRLTVLKQPTNRGALFNQVSVLTRGRGRYSALLLDKDSVEPSLIPAFLDFLRREAPASGYCEYHGAIDAPASLFAPGGPSLRRVGYSCHHPSGYFFRADDLRDIRSVERFVDHAVVGNFPFEFMQAELFLRGPAAIYQAPVFIPETLEAAQAVKSFTISGAKGDAFFMPKGRLKIAVCFSSHILGLPLATELKRQLVFDRFAQGLWHSTVGYRSIMANEAICDHYHVATRHVSRLEQLSIAFNFYRGFVSELKAARQGPERPTGLDVLMDTARRLLRRVGKQLGRQFA